MAFALYPASVNASAPPSSFKLKSLRPPSRRSSILLLTILHTPRSLSALVAFLDWSDLHSLLSTCRSLYSGLFSHISTRDAVLCRFVSGYTHCLRHRDVQFYQDVPITIHDLDLLLISQRTDLHRYPTHALRTLTLTDSSHARTSVKLTKLTQAHSRFVLLFQSLVHSSPLPIPPDPPEDSSAKSRLHEPSPELTFPPPLAFAPDLHERPLPPLPLPPPSKGAQITKSRKKHKHSTSQPPIQSHRPKHISKKPSASAYMISPSPTLTHHHHNNRFPLPPSLLSSSSSPLLSSPPNLRQSTTSSSSLSLSKPKRRISIFGISDPGPPPPPPEEPETLRIRSRDWRRARSASIISGSAPPSLRRPTPNHKSHPVSLDFDPYANAQYPSDTEFDFGELRRPRRLFASEHTANLASSSSSSISISETRSSWNQGQGSTTSSRSSPPVSPYGYYPYPRLPTPRNRTPTPTSYSNGNSPPFAPSIHSLLHATIRNRAPILRVFVPTQYMRLSSKDSSPMSTTDSSLERPPPLPPKGVNGASPSPQPQTYASLSIQACEAQLQEAGLWEHLSTGDVICNFGYIPLDEAESDPLYTPKVLSPSHRPSLRSFSHLPHTQYSQYQQQQTLKTWLIFTGESLLPYTPPGLLPLHFSSPLSLPSPFYYYHIMPPGANPLFQISELPPLVPSPGEPTRSTSANTKPDISFALIRTTSLIPSTLSPTGHVKVKKFAWTARILRSRLPPLAATSTQYSKNNPFGPLAQAENLTSQTMLPIPQEVGDGWLGEWVLEYEGTSEGRELLVAALEGKYLGKERVWEVRREISGGGRVWMRLLP